ncbi:FtsQ-type POTRA domain-containing protein [Sphingomonas koreensis]|nr:FtsQ-type POTRA domain-containing protein [Sphingomonas koreensis]
MSRTIRRGPPPRRAVVRGKKQQKKSLGDRLIALIGISEETLRRLVTWTIVAVVAALALLGATWMGVPGMVGTALAESLGRAGLKVEQIQITGLKRMDAQTVYAIALDQRSRAMPSLDLEDVRQQLLRYGWIKDAHVSRRLPNMLLIHIDERTPAAVWQDQGKLMLIDASGVLLSDVSPDQMPDLPLIIGEGANGQEPAYQTLLEAAPALRPRVRAATWIGNRRWNLLFDSGETLALPEENAAAALVKFAELDGADRLLGKGFVRFDMRDPTRLVARKPDSAVSHDISEDSTSRPAVYGGDTQAGRQIVFGSEQG